MQRAFNRDVINPQDGHILCVPHPAAIGSFRSRLLRSSRIANSAIRKPTNILVAFIMTTLLRDSRIVGRNVQVRAVVLLAQDRYGKQTALAETPKIWENFRWTGLGQKT
jgi:hypothetical protein